MKRMILLLVAAFFLLGAGVTGVALELGETSPAIKTGQWIHEGPIDLEKARGSNVLVVDFWATTRTACRYTIPFISELRKKFMDRGVVMIGISSEPPESVNKFLRTLDAPPGYAMAIDAGHQTSDAFLKGVGWEELPHTFVIDPEGKLVWHGSSTVALEKILDQLLAGKLEIEAARRTLAAEKQIKEYFTLANKSITSPRMAELADSIVANAAGYPLILNEFAWKILTDRLVRNRDYALALRASKVAYDVSEGRELPILDTYARSLFQAGKRAEAIEMEKKAIAACTDNRYRPELESVLMKFERISREQPLKK
jgi:peroxiredoxin